MTKVVINRCYGGFSLSAKATKRLSELQGKECHFFKVDYKGLDDRTYIPLTAAKAEKEFMWHAYTVPNPQDFPSNVVNNDPYYISNRPDNRSDPLLVQVVEELGSKANGSCAELEVVEIPDGIEYELSEYDGIERVEEVHRSWP